MKKILIFFILLMSIIMFVSCDDSTEPGTVPAGDTFEIYIATTESVREYGYYDVENLIIGSEPVIRGSDIRNYYWINHIIELNGSYMEKLSESGLQDYSSYEVETEGYRKYKAGGSYLMDTTQNLCFVIVVNGIKEYSGTFPVGKFLPEKDEQVIMGDISDDRIQIFYSGDGFDIRNNDAVYNYFQEEGKLDIVTDTVSADMVKELVAKLDEKETELADLQLKYDILREDSDFEYLFNDATVEWLRNRLNLYMMETQEGELHRLFSDALLELDLSDVSSIGEAADIFRQMAVANTSINDRMFNVFEEFYLTVINGIPVYNSIADIDEDFMQISKDNLVMVYEKEGKIIAYPLYPLYENEELVYKSLSTNFGVYLTQPLKEYLQLYDEERFVFLDNDAVTVTNGETVNVDIDDIGDLVYMWSKFKEDYPYTYPFNFKAGMKASEYLEIYIGRMDMVISPLYDEETMLMTEKARTSYERFINEYPDSPYHKLILDLYELLKMNGFVYNKSVVNFISGVDYEGYE